MARQTKQKRKTVELEERVVDCEKKLDMIISKTDLSAYNYLVRQIGQLGAQQQELLKSISLQQSYIKEIGKYDDFQSWLQDKLKEMDEQRKASAPLPQKPERPKSESEKKLEAEKGVLKKAVPKGEPKAEEPAGNPNCEVCGGRGYIGDNEECPKCHPNKR